MIGRNIKGDCRNAGGTLCFLNWMLLHTGVVYFENSENLTQFIHFSAFYYISIKFIKHIHVFVKVNYLLQGKEGEIAQFGHMGRGAVSLGHLS